VETLNVPATSAVVMLFAIVEPPPPVPQTIPSLKREPTRETKAVGAPSPVPPPPAAGDPAAAAAPVEAPASVMPETGNEGRVAGVVGGAVTGGIEGGVVGGTGKTASAPGPPGPAVVRVGAGLKPPKKIKDVRPEYPAALLSRAHGSVVIELTISAEGKVQDAQVLVSVPLLDQAALDAVRQWEYEPSVLHGVPVAVVMTVVVNFALQ
ncbi:MAG TPA: energy transducer TonB, partial [Vicinamibacterales bacterium]|nr:energy transducer TonB [Vicinamibacterales bacterium]